MAHDEDPKSPPTRAWVEPMPNYVFKQAQPFPTINEATAVAGVEECGRDQHQAWDTRIPQKFYEMHVQEMMHSAHPDLPPQRMWGFDGKYPGPTFRARYDEPVTVRIYNDLPSTTKGHGSPEISTHLHNLHNPSESDGFPSDYFSSTQCGPTLTRPGRYRDHHYVNYCAGGDPREAQGTLWYHDHRMDFTAANVSRGLIGFYLLFDALDSGDEHDTNPAALRLPSGEFDVPIALQDALFDTNGNRVFDQFDVEGTVGDKVMVNGKIQPVFQVQRRKYRFRFLDAGPLRFYDLVVTYNGANQAFQYIANDGNLLPSPLWRANVSLGVAERGDIVLDFSRFPPGSRLYLRNRAEQRKGRGPTGELLNPAPALLRFDVDAPLVEPDVSRVPAVLRPLEPLANILAGVVKTRSFRFKRDNGLWVVNNKLFDPFDTEVMVKKDSTEVWVLEPEGNWHHPVHIHLEEGRIISRNGNLPPAHERGRKDVYVLKPGEQVRFVMRFRDFVGRYPAHCHNTVHEDHSMMFRWDVVP